MAFSKQIFNKQKFLIAFICASLGWGVGYKMGQKQAEKEFQRQNSDFNFSPFFGMPKMPFLEDSPSLWERFFNSSDEENSEDSNQSLLDNPFSLFGSPKLQPNINTREDENFVYMEIDLDSFDKKSLSAKVEEGTVIIEGNQKSEEDGNSMSSHFYQSFPAPAGTDPAKVDMSHENNKLVLKFPKFKN